MKKVILTTAISFFVLTAAQAITLNEKEAKEFLEKTWSYLKKSDSTSFINLWQSDDAGSKNPQPPLRANVITDEFNYLRKYLDTEVAHRLEIDHIQIEKENLTDFENEYCLMAWFKSDEHYDKAFGLYVEYKNDKWVIRDVRTLKQGGTK